MDCEIEKNKISKKSSYGKAFKAAFPYTIPVMTGYLFIGMAFGVMIQEKGYNFLWAILMSVLCYAGLSLLERFAKMGKKRLYMIFSLTDETYSLFFVTKVPKDVDEGQFLFAIALLDQLYWIAGSAIGALLGSVLPIDTTGIDFAMTALFVVIMVEQWMESKNRPSVLIGLGCGLICLLIFGADNFILPTMICIMLILLPYRKFLDKETEQKKEVEHHAG